MNKSQQPKALRLAAFFDDIFISEEVNATTARKVSAELRRLHIRVQELEAQTAHMADLVELADYATKKLEASQAQRVPLTDEEISSLAAGPCWAEDGVDIYLFARAIERTHGIGKE